MLYHFPGNLIHDREHLSPRTSSYPINPEIKTSLIKVGLVASGNRIDEFVGEILFDIYTS